MEKNRKFTKIFMLKLFQGMTLSQPAQPPPIFSSPVNVHSLLTLGVFQRRLRSPELTLQGGENDLFQNSAG